MTNSKPRLLDLFEGKQAQKFILAVSVITILVLELLIYLAAAGQAGEKSRVIITNSQGLKVYETQGTALTSYERINFEKNYGPLSRYRVHIRTERIPFPFRAWLAAAIGIPVGLILLLAFAVKAFLALLYGSDERKDEDPLSATDGRVGTLFSFLNRISIFHIGFLLTVGVILFWLVPNFLGQFARISLSTVREYKWFFVGVFVFFAVLLVWVIYLRYRLSKKMLENQLDLEKYRVEQHLLMQKDTPALLTSRDSEGGNESTGGA